MCPPFSSSVLASLALLSRTRMSHKHNLTNPSFFVQLDLERNIHNLLNSMKNVWKRANDQAQVRVFPSPAEV